MLNFIKQNIAIIIIIIFLFSYLGIKALNPDGWDGWGFGSAQTLMSSQYWAKDGFANNYFLFIPRPYSKLIRYLDEPEFRNRPIDTASGELSRNRSLYYTHYPPGYLIPYALMAKAGMDNRAMFRVFSIFISLLGLWFFYLFTKKISNKSIAVIASIYYGFSVTFLNYADSISTQPWTILFLFLTFYLIVSQRNIWTIWTAYFALSLSSYDATFFVFAFIILFDVVIFKKFGWKKWLFLASAPVLGFALQVIQNAWYLGWQNAINDFYTYYAERAIGDIKNFLIGLTAPFVSMTGIKTFYFFKKTLVAFGAAALLFSILKYFHYFNNESNEKSRENFIFFKIVFVLAIAALVQPLFLNITGWWPYQGVLTALFWGLLIGGSSIALLRYNDVLKYWKKRAALLAILVLIVSGFWLFRFYDTLNYIKNWPNNKPSQEIIDFSKEIKSFYPDREKIMFRIYPQNPEWKSQFPIFNFEYYAGMLVIDFANSNELITDLEWLMNISEYPFYSFVMADNSFELEKIHREMIARNIKNISPIGSIQNQYFFTVGPK